jgi:hypothetical protein
MPAATRIAPRLPAMGRDMKYSDASSVTSARVGQILRPAIPIEPHLCRQPERSAPQVRKVEGPRFRATEPASALGAEALRLRRLRRLRSG